MLHCAMFSVIALVNFNVSLLHPTRKGRLKLIVSQLSIVKGHRGDLSKKVTAVEYNSFTVHYYKPLS